MTREQSMRVHDAFQAGLAHQTAGRLDQAEAIYRQILAAIPDHANSLHYLGIVRYKLGFIDEALQLMKKSVELCPSEPTFLQNLGGMFKDLNRPADAITLLEAAVATDPDNFVALSNLCATLHALGDDEKAVRYGQLALEAKDRSAVEVFTRKHGAPQLRCEARRFEPTKRNRNVIAFSLWGEDDYYIEGALENAMLAKYIYPEWMCRFYVDTTIRRNVIEQLTRHGSQVIQFALPAAGNFGLFWRFFPANDPTIDRFLCRDCDCRLNAKERVAVEEWIESGAGFHIMRDNVVHCELMLAGMWGGISGVLPDIKAMSEKYVRTCGDRWTDQHFLREEIWPLVKSHAFVHDSYYHLGDSHPFPRWGTLPRPGHVGGSTPRRPRTQGH